MRSLPPIARWPMPPRRCRCAYDAAYRLDAGDKLRVVVYGQEGLTNTYAIDAGGSITMPLIGAVPARGRTPAGLAAEISAQTAQRLYPRTLGGGRDRILPAVLHPRRSRSSRPISLCAQYERRKRGRDRRRLLAARPARPRHADPHRQLRRDPASWCRSAPRSAPAIPSSSANAGSDHARDSRSAASYPARGARAGRRNLPSHPRPRQRTGRPRPPCRHYRRQPDRRRTRRGGAGGDRTPPQARRSSPRHSPRAASRPTCWYGRVSCA